MRALGLGRRVSGPVLMRQRNAQNLLQLFEREQAVVTKASKAATKIHRERKQKGREANDTLRERQQG